LKLSEKRRLLLLEADAHYGSVLLTSDDMSEWDAIGRVRFRNALRVLLSRKR
jgi:hypothetical protein